MFYVLGFEIAIYVYLIFCIPGLDSQQKTYGFIREINGNSPGLFPCIRLSRWFCSFSMDSTSKLSHSQTISLGILSSLIKDSVCSGVQQGLDLDNLNILCKVRKANTKIL